MADNKVVDFIKMVEATCEKHNVDLHMSDKRAVALNADGSALCNGYFMEKPLKLVTACGQPFDQWFPVFVHESCHMDQWIEQIPEWTENFIDRFEAMDIVSLWVDGHIELNDEQLDKYISSSRAIELDCEIRTAKKILKYDLPIPLEEYVQKANSYVYFYNMIPKVRRWYTVDKEPYNIKEVWSAMPASFENDYGTIPEQLVELYMEHCL